MYRDSLEAGQTAGILVGPCPGDDLRRNDEKLGSLVENQMVSLAILCLDSKVLGGPKLLNIRQN